MLVFCIRARRMRWAHPYAGRSCDHPKDRQYPSPVCSPTLQILTLQWSPFPNVQIYPLTYIKGVKTVSQVTRKLPNFGLLYTYSRGQHVSRSWTPSNPMFLLMKNRKKAPFFEPAKSTTVPHTWVTLLRVRTAQQRPLQCAECSVGVVRYISVYITVAANTNSLL